MKQEAIQLFGKTVVITGATAGIGLAAAVTLAQRGASLICVGRDAGRCEQARQSILEAAPKTKVDFCMADLASQQQVKGLAVEISRLAGEKIDVLINNAGAVSSWYQATEDGYELTFAVNHLAPFLLTHELLPLLQDAPAGRVVTVSSHAHRTGRMHWNDVMLRRNYHVLRAYYQSKLANVLFTCEFNRRYASSRVRAYAADPGLVNTNIGLKNTASIAYQVWRWRSRGGKSPEAGAETVVFLACDPVVNGSDAPYWKDCQPRQPGRRALREEEANRLWTLSERLCGIG